MTGEVQDIEAVTENWRRCRVCGQSWDWEPYDVCPWTAEHAKAPKKSNFKPEILAIACALADEIRARRTGLDNEDRQAEGTTLRHYARAKKYREQDRARVNGMVIALSYVLGEPLDMPKAEEFIAAR